MKHSRNSQQIQGDFQDFEAPAPAEPEYAGEVTMALPPVPMPDPNARRGLAQPAAKRSVLWSVLGILGEVLMTLAAVCALYVVWQMWWTGVQSEHTQVETRQSASWSDPAGGDSSKVAKAQSGDVPVQRARQQRGQAGRQGQRRRERRGGGERRVEVLDLEQDLAGRDGGQLGRLDGVGGRLRCGVLVRVAHRALSRTSKRVRTTSPR